MTDDWATFGADLHVELRGTGLRTGLMDALREAVRSGRLTPGTRLPSSRSLAADLGIARNTVADAYAELVAEGWLTARQGSGTRVARRATPGARRPAPAAAPRPSPARSRPAYSLVAGSPDLASFPRAQWLKAARRALTAAPHEAFGYGDTRGRIELRTALAGYLARARGVYAEPGRIVVCSGFVHGLMLLATVLRSRRVREVAAESYGLDLHRRRLTEAGMRLPALPFDERGTRTEELAGPALKGVGAVLLTPAHQFPMGVALQPDRRAAAVDWARRTDGLILEDDYDGEFRYDRQPVGALQGLDPDRVVYLGTASKALAPGLRVGWMVLPAGLAEEVAAAKGESDWASGTPDQLTLAEFITSGAYDRQVRAMRLRYRRRRDQLVAALAERAPESASAASRPACTRSSNSRRARRHRSSRPRPGRAWPWRASPASGTLPPPPRATPSSSATAPRRTAPGRARWTRCAGSCRRGRPRPGPGVEVPSAPRADDATSTTGAGSCLHSRVCPAVSGTRSQSSRLGGGPPPWPFGHGRCPTARTSSSALRSHAPDAAGPALRADEAADEAIEDTP